VVGAHGGLLAEVKRAMPCSILGDNRRDPLEFPLGGELGKKYAPRKTSSCFPFEGLKVIPLCKSDGNAAKTVLRISSAE